MTEPVRIGTEFTKTEVEAAVREVTDDEVAFYLEHGWVKLERLISPDLAAELRRVGLAIAEHDQQASWLAFRPDAQPHGWFVLSDTMRRNAERFIDRHRLNDAGVPIRYGGDGFAVKLPGAGQGAIYHQDAVEHGSDRVGETRFWIAVDEVTPDMGPMRFIDGSHRLGPLGSVFASMGEGDKRDLLDYYPKLAERLTPLIEYQAGDATVHHAFMAHCGEIRNSTDRPRLSFLVNYQPADIRYFKGTLEGNPGQERSLLDDERHPIIYTPAAPA